VRRKGLGDIKEFWIPDFGLRGLSRQNYNVSFETVLAKVAVEGESLVESMMVDQSKAGAIDKAKVFVIISYKNRLGRLFDRFANAQHFDAGLLKTLHEFDGRLVTDSGADQGTGLGEDKIRC